jgi:hypothetical protein
MANSDITGIVAGFEAQTGFPAPLLDLVRELPTIMTAAEELYGPRDQSIQFDLKFEGRKFTDFGKTPVLITLGELASFAPANGGQWNVPEVRFGLTQEITQVMTKPQKQGDNLVWRNIDKGISTYFTLRMNPSGPWVSGPYEKAQRLFLKLVGICGEKAIRRIREARWGAHKTTSFANLDADDFRSAFPTLPESIILDLLEKWDQDNPVFPRERLWQAL